MQKPDSELTNIEHALADSLMKFEKMHIKSIEQSQAIYSNSRLITPLFIRVATQNFKCLQALLNFLTDHDIMNLAATCNSMYRFFYSPLGYRIINTLRPIRITIEKKNQSPVISQAMIENLCSDRSLANLDQDDKMAIILTMQTNLMATKQKIAELEDQIQRYDKKSQEVLNQISYVGGHRDQQLKKIGHLQDQIQKLQQLLKESSIHVDKLKEDQQKMVLEREIKVTVLQTQKSKLEHQKELLIKKIKSQQKEKQEGLTHSREVTRILNRLNKIIGQKKQ